MIEYRVIFEGTVRETYFVEANSEEEARDKWHDQEPDDIEVTDGEVTEVERLD